MKKKYRRVRKAGHHRADCRGKVFKHILVVEEVIGRPFEYPNEVHHINGDGWDNRNSNLVVCEDSSYHTLLHTRLSALRECGDPKKRRCTICKSYDDPDAMYYNDNSRSWGHLECRSRALSEWKRRKRNEERQA